MSTLNPGLGIDLPDAMNPHSAGVDVPSAAPESNYELGDGSESIRQLNALLRGEISAAETYRNVLAQAGASADGSDLAAALSDLQAEHLRAIAALRDRILEMKGLPAESSGIWGIWAQAVQETMTLFGGDTGGLGALHRGEEHGLKDYQNAVADLDPASANLVETVFVPAQQRHLKKLSDLMPS